jgi:hypothetical protein
MVQNLYGSKFIRFKIYTVQNLYGSKFIRSLYTVQNLYSSKFIWYEIYTFEKGKFSNKI